MTDPPAAASPPAASPPAVLPPAVLPVVITPLAGMPEVEPGDDLAALVIAALRRAGLDLRDGDVLVVSSKVVSKAEGLRVRQKAGAAAVAELRQAAIERESLRVVAERISPTGLTQVVETLAGPVMAAAGVDASNTGSADLLLLPRDPDHVAARLRAAILHRWANGTDGADARVPQLGLILSDTAGRPWRVGQTDFALGSAGVRLTEDLRGSVDAHGRALQVTERCVADEVAAAADLVKGKAAGVPVAHVRGIPTVVDDTAPGARSLVRTGPADWFALGSAEAVRAALGSPPGTARSRDAGIAATGPEPVPVRIARAVRVATRAVDGALDGAFEGVHADVQEGQVVLSAPDGFRAGYAAARVEVALAAEGLAATVLPGTPVAEAGSGTGSGSGTGTGTGATDSTARAAVTVVLTVRPETAPSAAG